MLEKEACSAMDLNDFIKQEADRLKKLESDLAYERAREERSTEGSQGAAKDAPPGLPTPPALEPPPFNGPERVIDAPRTAAAIESEIKEVKNSITAAEYARDSTVAQKVQELGQNGFEAVINVMGNLVDSAGPAMRNLGEHAVTEIKQAVPAIVDALIDYLGEKFEFRIPPELKDMGSKLLEITIERAELPEKWNSVKIEFEKGYNQLKELPDRAVEMTTQALQDANVLPSKAELRQVDELGAKQEKERADLDQNIQRIEKRFEEKFANDPRKDELGTKLQEQVDALRQALEDKQQREINQQLNIALQMQMR